MTERSANTAVVIGGTSGLGLGIAREFSRNNVEVVVGSRTRDKVSKALSALGKNVRGAVVDATNDKSLTDFFKSIGPFRYLVITAAEAFADRPLLKTSVEEFKAFADTKLWGSIRSIQAALQAGMEPDASIILISGAVARKGRSGAHAKAMVNGALEAFTRSLAVELGGRARVNCISPGIFDSKGSMPPEKKDEFKRLYPTGYVGNSQDIAELVYATAVNRFMTGSVVSIDGGWTAT
jgi:NAD(P)-dependent dehydrogenase (short-subunit alcohol dehydrogenase family)